MPASPHPYSILLVDRGTSRVNAGSLSLLDTLEREKGNIEYHPSTQLGPGPRHGHACLGSRKAEGCWHGELWGSVIWEGEKCAVKSSPPFGWKEAASALGKKTHEQLPEVSSR